MQILVKQTGAVETGAGRLRSAYHSITLLLAVLVLVYNTAGLRFAARPKTGCWCRFKSCLYRILNISGRRKLPGIIENMNVISCVKDITEFLMKRLVGL